MNYKVNDKIICTRTINNLINKPLFIKDNIYDIIEISEDKYYYTLNNMLYGNEYADFTKDFIDNNFNSIKQLRKEKLEKINENRR